jgi:hypothetical protein
VRFAEVTPEQTAGFAPNVIDGAEQEPVATFTIPVVAAK